MNSNGQSHSLLSTLSNLLSSRQAARGSWSEPAFRSAPIRWGLVAAFALRRMRSARVQAMVFPGMALMCANTQVIVLPDNRCLV